MTMREAMEKETSILLPEVKEGSKRRGRKGGWNYYRVARVVRYLLRAKRRKKNCTAKNWKRGWSQRSLTSEGKKKKEKNDLPVSFMAVTESGRGKPGKKKRGKTNLDQRNKSSKTHRRYPKTVSSHSLQRGKKGCFRNHIFLKRSKAGPKVGGATPGANPNECKERMTIDTKRSALT